MQFPLKYDFRDILSAPAGALAAKRILVMTVFLCAALAVYDIFTYLALFADGENINSTFSVYGLFPLDSFYFDKTFGFIFYWLGVAAALFLTMLGMFAVAGFEIEAIRGNRFMSIGEGFYLTFKRARQMLLSELSIISFLILIVILVALYGLMGRIPIVGEWIFSIFFVIPGFVLAIFTVFIAAVLIVSVLLLPAVAAADRNGETFDSILETFSTIIRQPIRWLGYTIFSGAAAKVCGFVYAYFAFRAVQFLSWGGSIGGGEKISELIKSGMNHLPIKSDIAQYTFNVFEGVNWSFDVASWARGANSESAASYVMALMLFLIFASVFGYMLCIIATAQARAFVIIRKLKDDYKISDEKPLYYAEGQLDAKSGDSVKKSE